MKIVYKVEFHVEVDNVKDEKQSLSDALADDKTTVRILDYDIKGDVKDA